MNSSDAETRSHNFLREVEKYHAYFRSLFEKVRRELSSVKNEVIRQLATMITNNTAGSACIIPKLLVFEVTLRLHVRPRKLLVHEQWMEALYAAVA